MKNKNTWKSNNKLNESGRRFQEDYGWEVPDENVWDLYEEMKEAFGAEELLESIAQALGTYELGQNLAYICRMNDFDSQYLEGHEDDDEEDEEEEEIKESKVKKVSESLSEDEDDDEDDDGDYLAHEVYKGYDLYAWEDPDFEGEIEYVTICKDDRVYSTTSSFERAKRMIDGGRIPTSLPPRVEPSWW